MDKGMENSLARLVGHFSSKNKEEFNKMAQDRKNKADAVVDISKSKAKREERRKEIAKGKRNRMMFRAISIVIVLSIVGVIAFFAGKGIYLNIIRTSSSSDMSEGLTADGKIEGVDAISAVTLADYKNIVIPPEELNTDEDVQKDIDSLLEQYKELRADASLAAADGDKLNIDYVGTIDGVEFEGGNSGGTGYDLTIGSNSFIDDFEQQLIGSHPGDKLDVEVTFPAEYQDAAVAGKDAVFAVTVNGIYQAAQFNDEFLTKNSLTTDEIRTADEYRQSKAKEYYEEKLGTFISKYIVENATVNAYPKNYVKIVKRTTKYSDEVTVSYYNQMFSSSGVSAYNNIWDLTGEADEFAYEKGLSTRANDTVKEALVYQAIFEKEGLALDMEAFYADLNEKNGSETYSETMIKTSGEGYIAQSRMHEVVLEYLVGLYK